MIRIKKGCLKELKKSVIGKKLFIFGAGFRAERCYTEWNLQEVTTAIVDNNIEKQGQWKVDKKKNVISKLELIQYIVGFGIENCVLLITPVFFYGEIISDLDNYNELNGLETYLVSTIVECTIPQNFKFTSGREKIPRIIHYCWFGKSKIPNQYMRWMKSWDKYCPDYEIKEWNETNYDITRNEYMLQAYEKNCWEFVSDYARLDIIYNYGGIYLDTDVEVIRNLDDLLCDECFLGFEYEGTINTGQGFGATKENKLIKELRDYYEDKRFINKDGSLNTMACSHYQNPVLLKKGFELRNTYQYKNGIVLYPSEVMAPIGVFTGRENFTTRTHSIHHATTSWIGKSENERKENSKKFLKERIFR